MPFDLNEVEARVLGALMEKDMSTPDYYPMSVNALTNACNQKTNRDPVLSLDEAAVERALERLRARQLALSRTGDSRVPKHAHRASETLNLGNPDLAVLCVLLLRGPQTVGELRARTQNLRAFDDLDAVESCLRRLMERQLEPLVKRLPRQAGMKESRYAHLLCGDVEVVEPAAAPERRDRIAELEATVESLTRELRDLRQQFADFRKQFE